MDQKGSENQTWTRLCQGKIINMDQKGLEKMNMDQEQLGNAILNMEYRSLGNQKLNMDQKGLGN